MTREEKINNLRKKLAQLKANETKMGKAELKAKYPVAYNKLREEIRTGFNELLNERVNGFKIPAKKIDMADLTKTAAEFKKKYTDALFAEYNADKALEVVDEMMTTFVSRFHVFFRLENVSVVQKM